MRIIKPYVIVREADSLKMLKNIEKAGRVCYKSEGSITDDSYKKFIGKLIKLEHFSQLEHEKMTVQIICDRGVSHELVRHRIASFSQESTRYCNYSADRFGNEITVIEPFFFEPDYTYSSNYDKWVEVCSICEQAYFDLLKNGATPQEARTILPNSLKTEVVITANLREWRLFFSLRAAKEAHPQMQQIAIPLLLHFKKELSPVFDDIEYNENFNKSEYAKIIVEEEYGKTLEWRIEHKQ